MQIINIDYKLKSNSKTNASPELKLYGLASKTLLNNEDFYEKLDRLYRNNSENHVVSTFKLNEDQIKLVKKMIETYYGEDFYNLDIEKQCRAIVDVANYLTNSRSPLSEWISDYIKTLSFIEKLT